MRGNKKTLALLLILFLCSFSLVGCGKDKEEKKDEQEKPKEVALYHDYQYCSFTSITESGSSIFLDGSLIYECQGTGEYSCYATLVHESDYCNTTDSLIMITDNGKDILYNYSTKKVVLEVDSFENKIYSENGFDAFFVFIKDGKYGLASMLGKVVIEPKYENIALANPVYGGEYSVKNNLIAAKNNGKVGVLEISTGKEVVPFENEHVRIYDNNFILTKEDKIIFTDLELKTIFEGDFDNMILIDDVLFVEIGNTLSFYDLTGNKLIEDTVEIVKPYEDSDDRGYIAQSMDQYNETITIEVLDEENEHFACYNLHVKEKQLEKFNCSEMAE